MVKLRVAVRVVSEEAYLASLETPVPRRTLPGEKRFLVIVRDPEERYIGSLVKEIELQYRSQYKQYAVAVEVSRNVMTDTATETSAPSWP